MSHLKKRGPVRFLGLDDTLRHQAGPFPFTSHLTLRQADALEVLRANMSDDEVANLFKPLSAARERVLAYMKRNPRPIKETAA